MTDRVSIISLGASLMLLAGCTSGTTYGTGSSHEEQTVKSIANMLAISADEQPNIDYSARPDLVMPADKQALPAPANTAAAADQGDWPVAPEEKIAAIRAAAPEPDPRSGNLPTEYLLSEKEGISNSAGRQTPMRTKSRDGGQFIKEIQYEAKHGAVSEEVKRRREQLTYSTGAQRKFLTEPPTEYRTPAATAEAGQAGLTPEEIAEMQKEAKREEQQNQRGMWTDN